MLMPQSRPNTFAITHALTSVPVLSHDGDASSPDREMPPHGLLYGVAAQEKLVALFDGVDDFESLARDATQCSLLVNWPVEINSRVR